MELHMLWFSVISCFNHKDSTSLTNLHFCSDLHQTKQQTPRAKHFKMHTKWQKQLIKGSKPVPTFSFRMMEINVCLTRVPFNRWKSFQEFSTNGMLNSSHECSHYYKLPPAVLLYRSAFPNWLLTALSEMASWFGRYYIPGEVKY